MNDFNKLHIVSLSIRSQEKEKVYIGKILFFPIYKKTILEYRYFIHYHIDEDRYHYTEIKPIYDEKKKCYIYEKNTHHTKQGLKDSINIIKNIYIRYACLKENLKTNMDYFLNKSNVAKINELLKNGKNKDIMKNNQSNINTEVKGFFL